MLHPVGTLQISQRFAPLNLPLDKIGNQKPSDVTSVSSATAAGPLAVRGATARAVRARRSTATWTTPTKLSAPAFEPLRQRRRAGGRRAAVGDRAAGAAQRALRDDHHRHGVRALRSPRSSTFWDGLFAHFRPAQRVARRALARRPRGGCSRSPTRSSSTATVHRRLPGGQHAPTRHAAASAATPRRRPTWTRPSQRDPALRETRPRDPARRGEPAA